MNMNSEFSLSRMAQQCVRIFDCAVIVGAALACPFGVSAADLGKADSMLVAKLDSGESVRVIVRMKAPAAAGMFSAPFSSPAAHLAFAHSALEVKNIKKLGTNGAVTADISKEGLASLQSDPAVLRVIEDRLSRPFLFDTVGLIEAGSNVIEASGGAGQVVVVLDTGINAEHPFLKGKIVEEACFSSPADPPDPNAKPGAATPWVRSSVCRAGLSSDYTAGAGKPCPAQVAGCSHGTHVAGIVAGSPAMLQSRKIRGVSPSARIISVQVFTQFDDQRACGAFSPCALSFASDQLRALEFVETIATKYKIAAVNMSLGSGGYSGPCTTDLLAEPPDENRKPVIQRLIERNIATVVATGNDGLPTQVASPACVPGVVAVGAITKAGALASYSNSSPLVSLLAPGDHVYSAALQGGFVEEDGTSMAAPHVAAAWALIKQAWPNATVAQVLNTLSATGKPVAEPTTLVARPSIRVAAALTLAASDSKKGAAMPSPASPVSTVGMTEGVSASSAKGLIVSLPESGPTGRAPTSQRYILRFPADSPAHSLPVGDLARQIQMSVGSTASVVVRPDRTVTVEDPQGISDRGAREIKDQFGERTRITNDQLSVPLQRNR